VVAAVTATGVTVEGTEVGQRATEARGRVMAMAADMEVVQREWKDKMDTERERQEVAEVAEAKRHAEEIAADQGSGETEEVVEDEPLVMDANTTFVLATDAHWEGAKVEREKGGKGFTSKRKKFIKVA